jgi:hypothetical protein
MLIPFPLKRAYQQKKQGSKSALLILHAHLWEISYPMYRICSWSLKKEEFNCQKKSAFGQINVSFSLGHICLYEAIRY